MKIQIETPQDILTVLQASCADETATEYKSLAWVIASFASMQVPANQDFECVINTVLLRTSHRSNPSAYSLQIQNKTDGRFLSASGHITDQTHITILLMRDGNKLTNHKINKSAIHEVKKWLESSSPEIIIPIQDISDSYQIRPEQFTYKIKCETGTTIKLKRLKTKWIITRK